MDSILNELKTMKLTESGLLSLGNSSALNSDHYRINNSNGSVWGNKSIWESPPHSPSTSVESMKTANNSISSINSSNSDKSLWASTQTSPIISNNPWEMSSCSSSTHSAAKISLNFPPCLNSTSVLNQANNNNNESLGSIWMIPPTNSQKSWDAPVPPTSFKSPADQFQLLRPHDIGNHIWCPDTAQVNKQPQMIASKQSHVGTTNPTLMNTRNFQKPPPLPPTYTQMMTSTPIKPLLPSLASNSLTANSCLQLFSDEFINYLNMIN